MRQRPNQAKGFTLIELLVVLVILGSLIGIVVLSVGIAGPSRELHNEAERLAGLIGVLAEEAVLENIEKISGREVLGGIPLQQHFGKCRRQRTGLTGQ